jgi:hypothetical protein
MSLSGIKISCKTVTQSSVGIHCNGHSLQLLRHHQLQHITVHCMQHQSTLEDRKRCCEKEECKLAVTVVACGAPHGGWIGLRSHQSSTVQNHQAEMYEQFLYLSLNASM